MKKLLCLLSISLIMITGCSKDDAASENSDSSTFFLKKRIYTDSSGEVYTENFNYNGNKLVSIIDSDDIAESFTYTGDFITKIELLEDGIVTNREVYEYNVEGKVIKQIVYDLEDNIGYKTILVYGNELEGRVNLAIYRGNLSSQTVLEDTQTLTFLPLSSEVESETSDGDYATYNSYDGKNNPFKNILGYNKICIVPEGVRFMGVNQNYTKVTQGTYPAGVYPEKVETYQFTYNTANYPVKDISKTDNVLDGTTEYFY